MCVCICSLVCVMKRGVLTRHKNPRAPGPSIPIPDSSPPVSCPWGG